MARFRNSYMALDFADNLAGRLPPKWSAIIQGNEFSIMDADENRIDLPPEKHLPTREWCNIIVRRAWKQFLRAGV